MGLAIRSQLSGWVLAGLVTLADVAAAQSVGLAAETLFQEGRKALDAGDWQNACERFHQSQVMEPAVGTLLGLGACKEHLELFASAWMSYTDAAALAGHEGQADREAFAKEKAAALFSRVSKITVSADAEVMALEGLKITLDKVALVAGVLNTEMPIDGGKHLLKVEAPGRQAWTQILEVPRSHARLQVRVPPLDDALPSSSPQDPAAPLVPGPAAQAPSEAPSRAAPIKEGVNPMAVEARRPGLDSMEWAGVGAMVLGVGSGVVSTIFLVQALNKDSESSSDCDGSTCGPAGGGLRDEAFELGKQATWFGVPASLLLVAGATLYFAGGGEEPTEAQVGIRLGPTGASLHGHF